MGTSERRAVLLTGVGKRYDIVSAFAQHATVIAADPSPLAPAQYAAHHRVAPPRIDDPGYVPFLAEVCARARRRRGRPAHRPRHRGARAGARRRDPARLRARPRDRARDVRQVRDAPAAAAPRPAVAADGAAGRAASTSYPVMVKPRRGSGARSIHLAHDAEEAAFFVRLREGADDGAARDGRPRVLDRLPLRPRRPLPQRDPAHDARVARRRVDQGRAARRPRAGGARPPRRRGARRARAVHGAGVPRQARSGSASPTSTRASAAPSRRRCTPRCRAAPTRS